MKKAIICSIALLAIALLAPTGSVWAEEGPAVEVSEVDLAAAQNEGRVDSETAEPTLEIEVPEASPVLAWNLPRCSTVHGTFCSQVGSYRRCLLAPYEPEICVCQSNNTWKCF